jgi:hypothetical protein
MIESYAFPFTRDDLGDSAESRLDKKTFLLSPFCVLITK